jgi:hypothetical protein
VGVGRKSEMGKEKEKWREGIIDFFMAIIIKNAVFWDRKPQSVPHRKHITSPLQRPVC